MTFTEGQLPVWLRFRLEALAWRWRRWRRHRKTKPIYLLHRLRSEVQFLDNAVQHEREVSLHSALESMCFQYIGDGIESPHLSHSFMSAGEEACATLARLFPDRWKDNGGGAEYIGPVDDAGWPVDHRWSYPKKDGRPT